MRKGIKVNGARPHQGILVIPVRSGGELHSLQFIAEDGSKRFLSSGRITGGYFSISSIQGADALCIAEGFATSATIHQVTGYPVEADRIRDKPGWEPGILNGNGWKPKGMHWSTFERLTARHDAFVQVSLTGMAERLNLLGESIEDWV